MKLTALLLNIALLAATFCTPLQQSFAQTTGNRDLVNREITDSDGFFKEMTRRPKPARDNTVRVEALLKKMTLEEKVGQMTQLTMGMFVSGQDQNVQIDGKARGFAKGERIHSENSYKYTQAEFDSMLREAGFSDISVWTDRAQAFWVFYAR